MNSINDVVRRITDGLNYSVKELGAIKKWLWEYQTANDMTLTELDNLCFKDSDWIFNQIFG